MHIQHVEVGNFRKLQAVRIDFSNQTTIFVGANNSGKTSAMVALRKFLLDRSDFSVHDITLCHWQQIDTAGLVWEGKQEEDSSFSLGSVLPYLDVWINVSPDELHYVQKLLPSLDWDGENIGVRLRLEPKDLDVLKHEYLTARAAAEAVLAEAKKHAQQALGNGPVEDQNQASSQFSLWPTTLMDFLARRVRTLFEVRAYLLDPSKLLPPENGVAYPQSLPSGSECITGDPFRQLIRVDEISAQRGFGLVSPKVRGDTATEDRDEKSSKKLSSQLRAYYSQHLDLLDQPEPKDFKALQALHEAQTAFGDRLSACFAEALKELEDIGYPGVTDPKLTITTLIKPVDGLNHAAAVQYEVPTHLAAEGVAHRLPEDSNGLGYQNLVSIVFELMAFRDKWMKVGKAGNVLGDEDLIPPLHLVLIEEPEAHLHAQVQQVFINQAYSILRKHDKLGNSNNLCTQLVVSTHSSHIAHEADFASLRYFRRLPAPAKQGAVPISSVINLSGIFGNDDKTERFVKRYIKATHCDLFFADGVVIVEGPAERILVPHLTRTRSAYDYLKRCYITWLEIGGSHAHTLQSLLIQLGLNTLIITDLDAKEAASEKAVAPRRGKGLRTRNETLKTWIPGEESLDALLDKNDAAISSVDQSGHGIRVAYQQPILVKFKSDESKEALANTFEDALLYSNLGLFTKLDGFGLIKKFRDHLADCADLDALSLAVSESLSGGDKAGMALNLLYSDEIKDLVVPAYIDRGLLWLAGQLKRKEEALHVAAAGVPK